MEPTNHPFRKETWSSKPPFLGSMLIFQGVWISSSRCLTTYRRYGNIDNPDQRIAQDIGSADGRTNSGCPRMEHELAVLEVWEDDMKKITTYEFWLSEESNEVTRSLGFLLFEIWISQIGWAVLKVRFLPLANLANLIIFGLGFHWLVAQPDSIRWLGAGFLCQGKYMTTFDNIWQTKRMPSTYDMNTCSQDTVLPNMTCLCRTWDTYGCFLVVQYEKTCFSISNPQSPCHGTLT